MQRVLFLADTYNFDKREGFRRGAMDQAQYRTNREIRLALAAVPHGVLYGPVLLGTMLKEAGIPIEILECAFRPFQRANLVSKLKEQPAVVGITTTFIMETEALQSYVALVRRYAPNAKIVIGGPSLFWNKEMRTMGDAYVMGEGEDIIVPLVQHLFEGRIPESLPSVGYRDANGEWKENAARLFKNMDDNPFPDWSLLKRNPDDFFILPTQRGCKYRCAFCTFPANEGWKLRYRSIPSIIEELKVNFEKYGIYRYMFADSTFTFPQDRCIELLNAIAALPFKIEWLAYARADNMSEAMGAAMQASGCVGLFYGVESGDEKVLLKMKKGFTTSQVREGVRIAKKYGISITASWIIGFPGETKETVRNTLNFILELDCAHNQINTFAVYDTSPLGYRPDAFGIKGWGGDWEHETMTSLEASRYTAFVLKKMVEKNIHLGSLFDFLWLSSIGYSPEQVANFFRSTERIQAGDATLIDGIRPQLEVIKRASAHHPIYREANGGRSTILPQMSV